MNAHVSSRASRNLALPMIARLLLIALVGVSLVAASPVAAFASEAPAGGPATGQAPTGQAPAGQAPTGQAPTGQPVSYTAAVVGGLCYSGLAFDGSDAALIAQTELQVIVDNGTVWVLQTAGTQVEGGPAATDGNNAVAGLDPVLQTAVRAKALADALAGSKASDSSYTRTATEISLTVKCSGGATVPPQAIACVTWVLLDDEGNPLAAYRHDIAPASDDASAGTPASQKTAQTPAAALASAAGGWASTALWEDAAKPAGADRVFGTVPTMPDGTPIADPAESEDMTGYVWVVDDPAWDEGIWVVDGAGWDESTWVVDSNAWTESVWVSTGVQWVGSNIWQCQCGSVIYSVEDCLGHPDVMIQYLINSRITTLSPTSYRCDECSQVFTNMYSAIQHMYDVHYSEHIVDLFKDHKYGDGYVDTGYYQDVYHDATGHWETIHHDEQGHWEALHHDEVGHWEKTA